jgi:MFS family permease
MRTILRKRELRLVFIANLVSMLGSGMNSAAVTWFVLQSTHSELALGTLVMVQTIPAVLMLPFTGVIIDREDRRRLVILLDASRAVIILLIAVLAFLGRVHVWQLYAMVVFVSAGFWMFWPTVTALIQELTPDSQFVHANSFLLAGVQGGWLLAGAMVGFAYNHIGLGGVLLIDFSTYLVSIACYLAVRKGKHLVRPPELHDRVLAAEGAVARYWRELRDGFHYLRHHRYVVLLGISWALFTAAMLTQGVVTAPLSDRILHAGAVGYGWLNAGWAVGALLSVVYVAPLIGRLPSLSAIALSMALLAACLSAAPFSRWLALAVAVYFIMGSGRGVAGVAISSGIMEIVPPHLMGRVQNTFYFAATGLQIALALLVGAMAHHVGLRYGFLIIGAVYAVAFVSAAWPVKASARIPAGTSEELPAS